MKIKFQNNLKNKITYNTLASPIGEIYIFADNYALKSIIISISKKDKEYINKTYFRKKTPVINEAIIFFNFFFINKTSNFPVSLMHKDNFIFVSDKNIFKSQHGLCLDVSSFTANEVNVYMSLLKIKYGDLISYSHLSDKAGFKLASRFIGNTMAKNLFPVLIPCHRVIKSDRTIGNYSGGKNIKKFLLKHEGNEILKFDKITNKIEKKIQ